VLADIVSGDVGVELANGSEGDFAHDRVAELGGEDAEVSCAGWVVVTRDDLGEDLAAEAGGGGLDCRRRWGRQPPD